MASDTERIVRRRVGRTVKIYARARGITVAELASAIGKSENQVYERLRGDTGIDVADLFAWAERLEVAPSQLLADTDKLLGLDGHGTVVAVAA